MGERGAQACLDYKGQECKDDIISPALMSP